MEAPIRLLLIEDNPGDARLVQEELAASRDVSFKVEHADRSQTGLQKLSQGSFDVVLLDLHLPDATGLENLIHVRQAAPDLAVVVMTGTFSIELGLDALKEGAQDYLLKDQMGPHVVRSIQYAIERKQLEIKQQKLVAALARAEVERKTEAMLIQTEKLTLLGRLAAGVAHELNSPLAGILELLRGFLRRSDPDSKDHKLFDAMRRAAEHAARIVRDLNAFSRAPKLALEPVEINDLIEKTLSFAGHGLETQQVIIKKRYADSLPQVQGDESQLQQVFLNMMTNARDAMAGKKEGDRELLIETASGDQTVEIRFTDKGEGIPEEILGKIFDPFFTTKGIGKGTGLGLSISYGIIERHNGAIKVESKPGEGTCFTICLPVAKVGG